jgi:hypothetical protein
MQLKTNPSNLNKTKKAWFIEMPGAVNLNNARFLNILYARNGLLKLNAMIKITVLSDILLTLQLLKIIMPWQFLLPEM